MDEFSKIDLHIHSSKSGETKEGDLEITKNSTKDNINILLSNLNENKINVCAITDHNVFDKDFYLKLKSFEGKTELKKVLPGVEMDILINNKPVHTICIFNDKNPDHAEIIESKFKTQENYSLSELGNILSEIGLDVILIAHQKTDYKAEQQHNTNLSSVGIGYFYKMVDAEYFDSLEVRSSKVEGILKNRFAQDNIKNQTIISGSDCHDWSVYPFHDQKDAKDAKDKNFVPLLMKMKAEPSFRGLVMAITNIKRFYSDDVQKKEPFISKIDLKINSINKSIPLSYGINAIIGDNSVGKSTLIKILLGKDCKGGEDFFKNHKIEVEKANISESDYLFNEQGSVRKKFDSDEKLSIKQEFKKQFLEIDLNHRTNQIKQILDDFIKLWNINEEKYVNDTKLKDKLDISIYDKKYSYFLLFKNDSINMTSNYSGLTKEFTKNIDSIKNFKDNYSKIIEQEDLNKIDKMYNDLISLRDKYMKLEIKEIFNNKIINDFSTVINNYKEETEDKKSSEESNYNIFLETKTKSCDCIIKKFKFANEKIINPFKDFESFKIEPKDNNLGEYHFLNKPEFQETITKETIIEFIKNKIAVENIFTAKQSEIMAKIKGKKFNDKVCQNLEVLKTELLNIFSDDYFKTTVEIKKGNDNLTEGNSAGINALYYLDIQSNLFDKKLFIIDQPEDDVSQTKINTVLLNSLHNFSKRAQVILITHNPQLVVNLDVDNVIVLQKEENNDEIKFISGPLERCDNEVDMIRVVADTLEGGIEVIKRRWKRYDKANQTRNIE